MAVTSVAQKLERIAQLVEQLVRRGATDRGRAVQFGPPVSPARVREFEARRGVTLPEGYARFLTDIGDGGWSSPDGTLLAFAEAERRSCASEAIAGAFEPQRDLRQPVDFRPPGMLWITDAGTYGSGLVLAGPERASVWEFVEIAPGWIPVSPIQVFRDERGQISPTEDFSEHYERALAPDNADLRVTFEDWLLPFLEQVARRPT